MLYARKDIPANLLSHDFPSAEGFFIEINLYKKKWLDKEMRFYKHFANFIFCIVSLNNQNALKIPRTLAVLI